MLLVTRGQTFAAFQAERAMDAMRRVRIFPVGYLGLISL
jgi:hypothetical protein